MKVQRSLRSVLGHFYHYLGFEGLNSYPHLLTSRTIAACSLSPWPDLFSPSYYPKRLAFSQAIT